MVLDIDGIGKDMKAIPISAVSEVPEVEVSPEVLDFQDIFLRYEQSRSIILKNTSNLFAWFIVHKPNNKYDGLGIISTDPDKG